jgi:Zn-dependent protease with chaperone function
MLSINPDSSPSETDKINSLVEENASREEESPNISDTVAEAIVETVSPNSFTEEASSEENILQPPPFPEEAVFTPIFRQWRDAGRPKQWRPMKPPAKLRLFWVLLATIIAFFQLLRLTVNYSLEAINYLIARLQGVFNWENAPNVRPYPPHFTIFCLIILLFSPWLIDAILRSYHTLQKLPLSRIENEYPETTELIRSWSRKHRFLAPKLQIITTKIPLILTYGSLPFTSRVVISTGLLKYLNDQELASLYGCQFGQIINGDFLWSSGMTTLLQFPHLLYRQISGLGENNFLKPFRVIFALLAALFYGIYRLWLISLLWLSRQRLYYSDRYGAELTGNPNALCRAFLKIAIGTSEQVQQLGYTPHILESFNLLLPVDPSQILSLGSLPAQVSYESVLGWECTNPYRHWLSLQHTHPLLGERLFLLGKCAQFWQIQPELDLPDRRPSLLNKAELWTKLANFRQALPLLPRSFLLAFGLGIIFRCAFWLVGIISEKLAFKPLIWMHSAYPLLNAWVGWLFIIMIILLIFLFSKRFPHIFACLVILKTILDLIARYSGGHLLWLNSRDPFFDAWMFITLSFSLIIWLNGYFPERKRASTLENPDIGELLANPAALPSQGQIVRLQGKLLGRKGIANWLSQDLLLHTPTGLIQLKYVSSLGPVGNLLSLFPRPCQYVNRDVTVIGWFRRGSAPWIDIDILSTAAGATLKSGYQIWLTLLSLAAALWGTYQILNI